MEQLSQETKRLMDERFGHDSVIALATQDGDMPSVRYVNAYYEDGAFYVITYALSNKMQQLGKIRTRRSQATGLRRTERASVSAILAKRRTGPSHKSCGRLLRHGLTTGITISRIKTPVSCVSN